MSETVSEHSSSGIGLPSFSKKTKVIAAVSIVTLLAGGVVAQTAGAKAVSLGSNGIEINTGQLDMNGNDIVSGSTLIWNSTSGEIPSDVVGIDLSTAAGDFLSWDSNNEDLNVDASSIQSGTTASDVGLGNVENEAAVAESGDTMSGTLDMGENTVTNLGLLRSTDSTPYNRIDMDSFSDMIVEADSGSLFLESSSDVTVESNPGKTTINSGTTVELNADVNADGNGPSTCTMSELGDWTCDGTKDWRHQLNETHVARYTSQESPEVRAVYEGKVEVDGETRVELPYHFSGTVSNSEPKLRATATVQGELAYAAVIEKTDDYLVLDSSEPATVNYRVTGIREGYEDKQIVKKKEK